MLNLLPREVLYEVCNTLASRHSSTRSSLLRGEPRQRRKALASLARTCRLFHEPAASALCSTAYNIHILIGTLPEDLWLEDALNDSGGLQPVRTSWLFHNDPSANLVLGKPFSRPPVQSDFARLKYYAQHIKHITYASTSLIAPHILDALATHFPAGTLLPNIRTLSCHWFMPRSSETYQLLQTFIGPKLRSLHLISSPASSDRRQPAADDLDCMRTVPSICPTLSQLSVQMEFQPTAQGITILSEVVRGFQDLTSFHVPGIPLDFKAISHLAKLQNLKTLYASLSDSITKDDYQSSISTSSVVQPPFPSLRTLHLENRFLFPCTLLLQTVFSPVLDMVDINTSSVFGFYCTSEDVAELCTELSYHPSLTSITVAVHTMLTGASLNRKTFEPLLLLPNLETLDLDLAHELDIDNGFLMAMAAAWPKLRRLEFCVDHPLWDSSPYAPSATLFGLVPFAVLCPHLRILGMPVDTNTTYRIPPRLLERRPGLGAPAAGSHVYHLNVGLSVVRDPVPVAAFLSDVFPKLIEVFTAWTDDMEGDMSEDLDGDIGSTLR